MARGKSLADVTRTSNDGCGAKKGNWTSYPLDPAPERRQTGTSWSQFVKMHGEVLAASDSCSVGVATWHGQIPPMLRHFTQGQKRSQPLAPHPVWHLQTASSASGALHLFKRRKTVSFRPLSALLTESVWPELLFIESKWSSLTSYGLTVKAF